MQANALLPYPMTTVGYALMIVVAVITFSSVFMLLWYKPAYVLCFYFYLLWYAAVLKNFTHNVKNCAHMNNLSYKLHNLWYQYTKVVHYDAF